MPTPEYAVIADLVGSRRTPGRSAVQRELERVLERVEGVVPSVDGLAPTVGDEFQGVYATLADATTAALLTRLLLLPTIDTRYGVGRGVREVVDAERSTAAPGTGRSRPRIEDGPAWWSARAAIDELASPPRTRRTWFVDADGERPAELVNAFLLCRDQVVDRLGERAHRMLAESICGATQAQIAAAEGITPAAVSQQFAGGVRAVRDAQRMITAVDDVR